MVVAELLTRLGFEVDPRELNLGLNRAKSSLAEFKGFLGKLALGLSFYEIGKSVLDTSRELETMTTQLQVMTGSADKAQVIFKGVTDYAKSTSFYMKDILNATVQMRMGMVPLDQIMPKVRILGDIATTSEQLASLSQVYGRVNAQGFAAGRELMRFRQGGNFDPTQQLALMAAEKAGLMQKGEDVGSGSATEAVMRTKQAEFRTLAMHRELTIGMIDQAIEYATTKGGMYFEHQLHQVHTFSGALTNMLDNLRISAGLAMQKLFPIAKELMIFTAHINLDWLGTAFTNLAAGLQYLWDVLKSTDMVAGWGAFKKSVADFIDTLGIVVGGTKGAGDSLRSFGEMLGAAMGAVFRISAALLELLGYLAYVVKFIREHNLLMVSLLALLMMFAGVGPAIAKVTTFMVSFSAATALASLRAFMLQGTLTSLWEYTKVFGTRSAMNAFFATSQAGMIGLTIATGWAIQKILELHEAIQDNASVNRQMEYGAWVANKSTAETEVKMAEREAFRNKGPRGDAFKELEANRKLLLAHKNLDFLLSHPVAKPSESGTPLQEDLSAKLMAQMSTDMGKITDGLSKLLPPAQQTAANTTPKGNVPNDVLRLAGMSFRTHFDVLANGIAQAAE